MKKDWYNRSEVQRKGSWQKEAEKRVGCLDWAAKETGFPGKQVEVKRLDLT